MREGSARRVSASASVMWVSPEKPSNPGAVPVLRGTGDGAVTSYPVPVPDFALDRIELTGQPVALPVSGPTMVLATSGAVTVAALSGARLSLAVGTAAFVGADEEGITLSGTGEAFLARPGV